MESNEIIEEQQNDLLAENLSDILVKHGLSYKTDECYHSVSLSNFSEYKVFYISVVQSQIRDLIHTLLPYLAAEGFSFRIPKDQEMVLSIMNGWLGYDYIGKAIIIYVPASCNFSLVTKQLVELTEKFNGPIIPGEQHLGGLLYLMNENPEPVTFNFKKFQILRNQYMLSTILKPDPKGSVWKGFYINSFFNMGRCVIKEGTMFMWSDLAGRDMKDRLKWQQKIHEDLTGLINIPKIYDLFEDQGNTYLVMEFVKGKNLEQIVNETYNGKKWEQLTRKAKNHLLDLLLEILNMIRIIHEKGYVHRDLTPANFLLTHGNKLYIIDWELAYGTNLEYPLPPFTLGTMGFMSPEQFNKAKPSYEEDFYGLGALMTFVFTGVGNVVSIVENPAEIRTKIYSLTGDLQITNLIQKCLNESPLTRPNLLEIKQGLKSIKQTIN